MNKKGLLIFFSLLTLSFVATGCDSSTSSNSSSVSQSSSSSFEELTTDELTEGAYSGWLEDVTVVNRFLGNDSRYEFTYKAPNNDLNLRVVSSHESVLTIEKSESDVSSYVMVTHNPGDSILSIYDSEDYLYFRKVIRVRTAYDENTIKKAAFDNDIYAGFKGFGGSYRLTCTKTSPSFTWQLTGKDEVEVGGMDIVFDCKYLSFNSAWDMYIYETTIVSEHEKNQTKIVYLYISRTADFLNLYYDIGGGDNALLNAFSPVIYSDIRPGFIG